MLSYVMLCYAMLCYAMLCYVILCYVLETSRVNRTEVQQLLKILIRGSKRKLYEIEIYIFGKVGAWRYVE